MTMHYRDLLDRLGALSVTARRTALATETTDCPCYTVKDNPQKCPGSVGALRGRHYDWRS